MSTPIGTPEEIAAADQRIKDLYAELDLLHQDYYWIYDGKTPEAIQAMEARPLSIWTDLEAAKREYGRLLGQ
jgi:hypothetical protein